MKVRISALDTWTFGVGKPSVWGEDTFSAGMFPPFPSVIRGAARSSALFAAGSVEIANTDADPTKDSFISEYALLLRDMPYFPAPADFVWSEEDKKLLLCELRDNDGLSSITTPCQLWAEAQGKVTSAEKRYISHEALGAYLRGEAVDASEALSDYILPEDKIGIFRDRGTRTAREHMLYRSPLVRPRDAALAANIENLRADGVIRFGGENKTAHFTAYDGPLSPEGAISEDGGFKLYLATPAIFADGYLPRLPVQAALLTAAVYGYDSVGGFDMKARWPKPTRRAVKAGSVYYFRLEQNSEENRAAILRLHGARVGDFSSEDGFGISYIGKI